jgi:hypothetical protein
LAATAGKLTKTDIKDFMTGPNRQNLSPFAIWIILFQTAIIATMLYFFFKGDAFNLNLQLKNFLDDIFPEFLGALWCGYSTR